MRYSLLTVAMAVVLCIAGCDGDDNGNGPITVDGLAAVNGLYYKGEMGGSSLTPELVFGVKDSDGNWLPNYQIQLHQIAGDGELSSRSVTTDSTGLAAVTYSFDADLGHAEILATARSEQDSVTVFLRANTLIPGDSGQGQYVLLNDIFATVTAINGSPASVDVYTNHETTYMNYEDSLGVVVMIDDPDDQNQYFDTSSVRGVIVNTRYEGTTAEGIGIGSNMSDLRAAYGEPDSVRYSFEDILVRYWSLGMDCFCSDNADTTVIEIHIKTPSSPEELNAVSPATALEGHHPLRSRGAYRLIR